MIFFLKNVEGFCQSVIRFPSGKPCQFYFEGKPLNIPHAHSVTLVVSHSLRPHRLCPPGSSVHGVLQARTLEWVAIPLSRDPPHPGIEPEFLMSPALAGEFFTTLVPPGKPPEYPTTF